MKASNFASHSGYINVNESANANLFYWFFESQSSPQDDPVVLWMTGGPGCSGELAIFFENGPYQVTDDLTLTPNAYSWNKISNIIYIDQPVGVGYSYANSDYVTGETLVKEDVYNFLQGFFANFTQFQKNDFFIVGESYGGHYVPSVATAIVTGNSNNNSIQINLKGIAIGNGLVDPINQDESYGVFGYKYGLINESVYAQVNESYAECKEDFEMGNYTAAEENCLPLMSMVLADRPINYYDVDTQCNPPPLCYDLTNITNYLNQNSVKKSIGVNPKIQWGACNFKVNERFGIDIQESFAYEVADLLDSGVPVLVYSGMLDLICNYIGGDFWTSRLEWSGQDNFVATPFSDWMDSNNEVAGHLRMYNNFAFLEVEDAGHMVPHDQPARALELLQTFLMNAPFKN